MVILMNSLKESPMAISSGSTTLEIELLLLSLHSLLPKFVSHHDACKESFGIIIDRAELGTFNGHPYLFVHDSCPSNKSDGSTNFKSGKDPFCGGND